MKLQNWVLSLCSFLFVSGAWAAANDLEGTASTKTTNNHWLLKQTWANPESDMTNECDIDNEGKVVMRQNRALVNKPAIANFDKAAVLLQIKDARSGKVLTNKSSAKNQASYEGQRTKKDYFARIGSKVTDSVLLRHEELEKSSQNQAQSTQALIDLIDSACGNKTHAN